MLKHIAGYYLFCKTYCQCHFHSEGCHFTQNIITRSHESLSLHFPNYKPVSDKAHELFRYPGAYRSLALTRISSPVH